MTDKQWILDSPEDWLFFFLGAILSFFLVYSHYPSIVYSLTEHELNSIQFSGEKISISQVHLDRLKEDYNPLRMHEVAYCGRIDKGIVKDFIVADIYASSPVFSISTCPIDFKMWTHTHPLTSKPLLSEQDKKTFLADERADISCVYGAYVLNCFTKFGGDVVRVEVVEIL